jgi:hypothetical protein
MFIGTSNQLGEFESGVTAALFGAVPAAIIGGFGTILVALLWMRLFPALRKADSFESARRREAPLRRGASPVPVVPPRGEELVRAHVVAPGDH